MSSVYFDFSQFKDFLKGKSGDIYAVIGNPVRHSMSPKLHSLLIKDCNYYAVELKAEELKDFCIFAKEKLKGFNITVPYKKDIIKYLDNTDMLAKDIGSVNTVKTENGRLYGYNTDMYGLLTAIKEHNIEIKNKNILILGAGGIALTAVYALKKEGGNITVAARDVLKAENSIKNTAVIDINNIKGSYDIVINCTPCGMTGQEDNSAVDIKNIPCEFLFDTIYNPLKTKLIKDAENAGITAANGLNMLIYQAVKAQNIWGNTLKYNIDTIRNVLISQIIMQRLKSKNKKGIALCGFMGSGKSTAAKYMETQYGFKNIDTDKLIEQHTGLAITQIFEKYGEEEFRNIESNMLKNINYDETPVISLGGGTVIKNINAEEIKRNNILVYIDIELETALIRAKGDGNRPLLNKSKDEILQLYNSRKKLYENVCDIKVNGNFQTEKTVSEIIDNI